MSEAKDGDRCCDGCLTKKGSLQGLRHLDAYQVEQLMGPSPSYGAISYLYICMYMYMYIYIYMLIMLIDVNIDANILIDVNIC